MQFWFLFKKKGPFCWKSSKYFGDFLWISLSFCAVVKGVELLPVLFNFFLLFLLNTRNLQVWQLRERKFLLLHGTFLDFLVVTAAANDPPLTPNPHHMAFLLFRCSFLALLFWSFWLGYWRCVICVCLRLSPSVFIANIATFATCWLIVTVRLHLWRVIIPRLPSSVFLFPEIIAFYLFQTFPSNCHLQTLWHLSALMIPLHSLFTGSFQIDAIQSSEL